MQSFDQKKGRPWEHLNEDIAQIIHIKHSQKKKSPPLSEAHTHTHTLHIQTLHKDQQTADIALCWPSSDGIISLQSERERGNKTNGEGENERGLKCVKGSNWPLLLYLRTVRRLRLCRYAYTSGCLQAQTHSVHLQFPCCCCLKPTTRLHLGFTHVCLWQMVISSSSLLHTCTRPKLAFWWNKVASVCVCECVFGGRGIPK